MRWVSKSVTTHLGTFTVRWPFNHSWWFSTYPWITGDGIIFWPTIRPKGMLIKHPCGTKRFIKTGPDFQHMMPIIDPPGWQDWFTPNEADYPPMAYSADYTSNWTPRRTDVLDSAPADTKEDLEKLAETFGIFFP